MKKKTVIIISVLVIAVCVAVTVGTTVALYTGDTEISISFTAGKVSVAANVSNIQLYSAHADKNGSLVDTATGNTYSYRHAGNKFANGGNVNFDEENKSLALENISAGDKVEFDIDLQNNSTVQVVYQVGLALINQASSPLFNELAFDVKLADQTDSLELAIDAQTKYTSEKLALAVNQQGKVTVSIALPISSTLQATSINLRCFVFAIQDTEAIDGVAIVERDGHVEDCVTLQEAINYANNGETIYIVHGIEDDTSGIVRINKSLKIESYNDEVFMFNNIQLVIENTTLENTSVEISHMGFVGNSYIDVSKATSLTMHDCVVNAAPSKLFDATIEQDLPKAGFVVSTNSQMSNTYVNIYNNTFVTPENATADYSAIYLNGLVANGSVISQNTFGSADKPWVGTPVTITSAQTSAVINVAKNNFFANTAIEVSGPNNYSVVLNSNSVVGEGTPLLLAVDGVATVSVYDSKSVVNNSQVSFANFDMGSNQRFVGINVSFYESSLGSLNVVEGLFRLCDGYTQQMFENSNTMPGIQTNISYDNP